MRALDLVPVLVIHDGLKALYADYVLDSFLLRSHDEISALLTEWGEVSLCYS